jgi:hypothetical protein
VNLRWTILLVSALLAGAAEAAPDDKTDVVRDLAGRVGPMVGSALACRDIARPRIQLIVDKFTAVITQSSSSEAERADLTQLLDRNIADGRTAVTSERMDCRLAERQLADLERSIARPPLPAAAPPSAAVAPSFAAAAATAPTAPVAVGPPVRGITDREIITQVVPAVSGYSSLVLDYKNSLAKYFPGEAADYVSLEGFISANILIEAIKRTGPQLDTEKLIDVLENMRNLDLGLGVPLNFGRAEHQASHKIWGTAIDENGKYQAIELE